MDAIASSCAGAASGNKCTAERHVPDSSKLSCKGKLPKGGKELLYLVEEGGAPFRLESFSTQDHVDSGD